MTPVPSVEPAAQAAPIQISPLVRYILFAGTFVMLLAIWAAVLAGLHVTQTELLAHSLAGVASFAPVVLQQLSVTSELTPAILGGLLAFVAPPRSSTFQTLSILTLAALCWLAYLHLQIVIDTVGAQTLLLADVAPEKLTSNVAVLSTIAGSIRYFCAVVFAAIVGLRLNPGIAAFGPATDKKGGVVKADDPAQAEIVEPADVPDPSPGQKGPMG
ncbi:hypothetical protein [Devosia sediminis]|uniref:Uncharacterized protein n=1 Tax=Devosia sediminis TaxID=2798801 RepID=A0A934J301_9HYPH|nr:hypothetical protein [Devosia sediminis]MBJ3786830.1 hypothetical protein [Devosia sediminis]